VIEKILFLVNFTLILYFRLEEARKILLKFDFPS